MSLGKTQFPWQPCILDTGPPRSASPTVVARNKDMIGLRFCNTGSDDTDSNFRHKLYRDPCSRIRAFEIVDQLFKILDRVDVVMRGRRYQADTRSRVSRTSDWARNLVSWQL